MPENKRNILLIENQQRQFNKIIDKLNGFAVFPIKDEYINFIDHVRVAINSSYNGDYRTKGLNKIISTIEVKNIDLVIMDYVLGGADICESGILLAEEILKDEKIKNKKLPIIFFSKIPENDKLRTEQFEKFKKDFDWITEDNWLSKRFNHFELFQEDLGDADNSYIVKELIPKIKKLIPKSMEQRFEEAKSKLLELNFSNNFSDTRDCLLDLTLDKVYKNEDKLKEFEKCANNKSTSELKTFFEKI